MGVVCEKMFQIHYTCSTIPKGFIGYERGDENFSNEMRLKKETLKIE